MNLETGLSLADSTLGMISKIVSMAMEAKARSEAEQVEFQQKMEAAVATLEGKVEQGDIDHDTLTQKTKDIIEGE